MNLVDPVFRYVGNIRLVPLTRLFHAFSHPLLLLYHLQYSTIGFLTLQSKNGRQNWNQKVWKPILSYFHVTTVPYLEFSAMRPETPPTPKYHVRRNYGEKNDTADRLSNLRKFPGGRNTVRSLRSKQRIPLGTYREAPARRTQCLTLCRRQRRLALPEDISRHCVTSYRLIQ